ncbi:BLUF domain-containing protein [uncultured Pseudacidovorax sp.]|uniref:BLUF domain-containing protein n=1 Tax=uncultured Pseudacidovorax sp. TaxID=679313 RepID=UPI0025F99793|nr:BLUF domain-containing protein [uncultured Pseudacidovorax sp.]
MIYRLIYASRARAFRSDDVAGILRQSRDNNAAASITGALCLLDGVYMQYLEGPQAAVERLYSIILADDRHQQVKLLDRGPAPARVFADWSMALLDWDERIRAVFLLHGMPQPLDLYATPSDQAAALFGALARTPGWVPL